jgi:hypothetical protein
MVKNGRFRASEEGIVGRLFVRQADLEFVRLGASQLGGRQTRRLSGLEPDS